MAYTFKTLYKTDYPNNYVEPSVIGSTAIGSRAVAFVSPDRLNVCVQELITGKNRTSQKVYKRWRTQREFSLSTRRAGRLMAYSKTYGECPPGGGRRSSDFRNISNKPSLYWTHSPEVREVISEWLGQEVYDGIDLAQIIYPSLKGLSGFGGHTYIPPELSRHLRNVDFGVFVRRAFRARNYRKDLVKSLRNATLEEAIYGQRLVLGGTPVDWVIEGFRADYEIGGPRYAPEILQLMTPTRARRLILSEFGADHPHNRQIYQDTDRMWLEVHDNTPRREQAIDAIRGARNWGDVHDIWMTLPGQQRRRGRAYTPPPPPKNEPIEPTREAKKILEMQPGEFKIVAAAETDQLHQWSDEMHNCIRSYAREAVAKSCTLAAVYDGDKLIANMEIRGKRLAQFLGRRNQHLSPDWQIKIITALMENDVINEFSGAYGVSVAVSVAGSPGPNDMWLVEPEPAIDPAGLVRARALPEGELIGVDYAGPF